MVEIRDAVVWVVSNTSEANVIRRTKPEVSRLSKYCAIELVYSNNINAIAKIKTAEN